LQEIQEISKDASNYRGTTINHSSLSNAMAKETTNTVGKRIGVGA
jgi:hypothetical protein